MSRSTGPDSTDGIQRLDPDLSVWRGLSLTEDNDFRELKRKYLSASEKDLDLVGPDGAPLGFFRKQDFRTGPLRLSALRPLIGWECTPWRRGEVGDNALADWAQRIQALESVSGWDLAQCPGLAKEESALFQQALRTAGVHHARHEERVRVIAGFSNFDEYLGSLSKRQRTRCQQSFKETQKQGYVVGKDFGIDEIKSLYLRRSLNAEYDYSQDPAFHSFLGELIKSLKAQDRYYQVGIFHQGELIAMGLGFWRDGVFFFYQTAYDPRFQKSGPGSMAIYQMLRDVLVPRTRLFSFMGDFPYFGFFTRQIVESERIDVYSRRSHRARALRWLQQVKRMIGR